MLKSVLNKSILTKNCIAVEYIVAIYVAVTSIVNLLNIAEIISFTSWFMKPTFFGVSMVIMMLVQYGVMNVNRQSKVLDRVRPYIVGLVVAGIISICNIPLNLLLVLLIGYLLMMGYGSKFELKEAVLTALVACTGIEVYGVALMLANMNISAGGFMSSIGPDILFVLTAVAYCFVDRETKTMEEAVEEVCEDAVGDTATKPKREIQNILVKKCSTYKEWICANLGRIIQYIGGCLCVLALGLFLFYLVSTVAGANKIAGSGENVFLLQNCEDTSLVLTLSEDKETESYKVSFRNYEGTNNQKVQLIDTGDGMYQIVFLEPEYALEVEVSEDRTQIFLSAQQMDGSYTQRWSREAFDENRSFYTFNCAYGVPLCYEILSQAEGIPEIMVQASSGGYEFFTLERTVGDEFVTKMVEQHQDEFAPTMLMETLISYLGEWSIILFIFIILVFVGILYMKRFIGDKLAALNAIIFAYLLAYGAISAMALFVVVFVLQCIANISGNEGSNHGTN